MKCPACGGELILDCIHDEYYCKQCGRVFNRHVVESYEPTYNVYPIGTDGKGSYYERKNDISTYRLLNLQKIYTFLKKYNFSDTVYDYVVLMLKKHSDEWGVWKFNLIVALMIYAIYKHGYYISTKKVAKYFKIKPAILQKEYDRVCSVLGRQVVDSRFIASFLRAKENACVKDCLSKMFKKYGRIDYKYGMSPRLVALTYVLICKIKCGEKVNISKYFRENNIPRNSFIRNLKYLTGNDVRSLTYKSLKEAVKEVDVDVDESN